ncbi:MAG: hypothetical protein WCO57_14030 [Verrucomicrobiota bacterium]
MNDAFCDLPSFAFGINDLLRGTSALSVDQQKAVALLGEGIASSTEVKTTVFYRGCSLSEFYAQVKTEIFTSNAFLSVTINPVEAVNFAKKCDENDRLLLRIGFPEPPRLLQISSLDHQSLEQEEFLVAQNSQFQIFDWDGQSGQSEAETMHLQCVDLSSIKFLKLEAISQAKLGGAYLQSPA